MMYYTHAAFGLLSALFVYPAFPTLPPVPYFLLVLFGALLPDIDHRESIISRWFYPIAWTITLFSRHRGIVHSLFFVAGLFFGISYFLDISYAIPFIAGYFSHLFLDSLTVRGINYLYPLTTFKISGFIETGRAGEFVLLIFLLAAIIIKSFFL